MDEYCLNTDAVLVCIKADLEQCVKSDTIDALKADAASASIILDEVKECLAKITALEDRKADRSEAATKQVVQAVATVLEPRKGSMGLELQISAGMEQMSASRKEWPLEEFKPNSLVQDKQQVQIGQAKPNVKEPRRESHVSNVEPWDDFQAAMSNISAKHDDADRFHNAPHGLSQRNNHAHTTPCGDEKAVNIKGNGKVTSCDQHIPAPMAASMRRSSRVCAPDLGSFASVRDHACAVTNTSGKRRTAKGGAGTQPSGIGVSTTNITASDTLGPGLLKRGRVPEPSLRSVSAKAS